MTSQKSIHHKILRGEQCMAAGDIKSRHKLSQQSLIIQEINRPCNCYESKINEQTTAELQWYSVTKFFLH